MHLREALIADIPQMQTVRNSVRENVLSNPALVRDSDYVEYLEHRGKGWVCEFENRIVGFAIADIIDNNIWALFVHPDFDKRGIGRKLHNIMLNWYFSQTDLPVWLGTEPNSRAEAFYRKAGWQEVGMHGKEELKFEMTCAQWKALTASSEYFKI